MSFKWVLRFILFFVTSIVIFYQFGEIPKYLFYDEVDFAKLAVSLTHQPYTSYSPLATGHSTLYFYILLASLKVFGLSTIALRIPAAFFGGFSVLVFYLLIELIWNMYKKQYGHIYAFFLSLIFITSRWYFNFARFSFEATFLVALELLSTYFFFLLCYTKERKYAVLSAFVAGLAFHSYTPGRIFFIVPMILIAYMFRKYLIPFVVAFMITIAPLAGYLVTHNDSRLDTQLYINNTQYSLAQKTGIFFENIQKTGLMLITNGDMNGRHNYPGKAALNPVLFLFAMTGFGITLMYWNKTTNLYFLLWTIVSIVPTALSSPLENPNMLRTITLTPIITYYIGNSIYYLFLRFNKKYWKVIIMILCILFIFSTWYELHTYFSFQKDVFIDDAFKSKEPLQNLIRW